MNKSNDVEFGYNSNSGGHGNNKYTEEACDNISKGRNGQPFYVFNKHTKELVGEYFNKERLGRELKIESSQICECLEESNPNLISVGDYIVIYKNNFTEEKLNEKLSRCYGVIKPIVVINKVNKKIAFTCETKDEVYSRIPKLSQVELDTCLNGTRISAQGFFFVYEDEYSEDTLVELSKKTRYSRLFSGFDLDNNKLGTWSSVSDASKELGIESKHISSCLVGKQKTLFKKYKFQYIDEEGDIV